MPLYQSHKLRQRAAPLPLRDRQKPHQLCTPEAHANRCHGLQARSPPPRATAPEGYGHSRFCELYEVWKSRLSPTMRQVHPAGAWLFVDNAGQTVDFPIEQREVDRVAHLAVAAIARGQAVAAIVDSSPLGRNLGIMQRGIEVGDTVEGSAFPYPGIHRDPVLLPRRCRSGVHRG